jgi:uncharacterized protein (DUF952 family)
MILHFCPRSTWEAARAAGVYTADTLATEGFIHLSTVDTVLLPVNAIAVGQHDLVLLAVDEDALEAPVRWEGEPAFPHAYGPINIDAVVAVYEFPCQPDGSFQLPPALGGAGTVSA